MSSRIRAFLAIAVLVIGIAGLNWIHPESTDVVRASTTDSTQAARPRVLVISIDGMRPDLLLLGDTPVVHDLIKTGSYSMWAQTTAVAITLPSHVSMLTGVRPNAHGIDWNRDLPLNERVYPAVPTYFELAKLAGYSTAMVAGKDKLSVLNKPGTIDWSITPATGWANHESVERDAVRLITSQKPEVMFVHFSDVDVSGHQSGWSSKEQMNAIAKVDKSIGMVLDALKAAGVREQTLVIVTSDHGGAGYNHGADDIRSRCIPWIANGPGVKQNVDLTFADPTRTIKTEDTFATAMWQLKINLPERCEGKPVLAAFESAEQPK